MTTPTGDTTIPPLTTSTTLIEEGLVKEEQTNEVYLPLTSTVVLKRKQEMLYVPLDFENNLTADAMVDSVAFVSAIAQIDLDKIEEKALNSILKIDNPPNYQMQVANGQWEKPLATATLKIEIGDNTFAEHFIVMSKLTGPIIALHFMSKNRVVIDTTHGLIHFPQLIMRVKTASSETTTKLQPVITDDALTVLPTTTKTITDFVDYPSNWNTTGTVAPLEKFTETASSLIFHSMSTINDKRLAVRVTNTTELPNLIKKHTKIAEFSVVTPAQPKHVKRVDMAVLSIILQGDLDLTAYLNEFLQTIKTRAAKHYILVPNTWKPWKAWGSHPNTDKNRQRINWTQRQGKTECTTEHKISKQNSQTIWLDWPTSNINRETSNWRYSCRLSWHFRQTQNGYWNEYGAQGEINPGRRQSCL